jgi:short-subunit dehydrogenase
MTAPFWPACREDRRRSASPQCLLSAMMVHDGKYATTSTANGRWSPEPARASALRWRANWPPTAQSSFSPRAAKTALKRWPPNLTGKGTEVRIVTADLNDPAAPQQIYDATEGAGLAVDILINNAGLGQFGAFAESPIEQELSQVRVNCEAMVRLTRLFVPRMVERRRGWIMILASTASFQPVPYLTTYAATKAFDRFFALGLAAEVARFGVKVTALCPGPTESEFFQVARSENFMPGGKQTAEAVARLGVAALARGRRTIVPTSAARFTACWCAFCPVGLITHFIEKRAPESRPK